MKRYFTIGLIVCSCAFLKQVQAASPYDFDGIDQAALNLSGYANLLGGELFTQSERAEWRVFEVTLQFTEMYDAVVTSWIPIDQNAQTWTKQIYSELRSEHALLLLKSAFKEPDNCAKAFFDHEVCFQANAVTNGEFVSRPLTLSVLADLTWVKAERLIPNVGPTQSLLLRYVERYRSPLEAIRRGNGVNMYWQERFQTVEL